MGQSRTKQDIQFSNNQQRQITKPQKCILIQNPQTLLIVLSNGNMENIFINNFRGEINLNLVIQPGVYFCQQNKVYFVVEAENLSDELLIQTVHGYFLASRSRESLLIQPEKIYFIKEEEKFLLVVESKALGEENCKFVDLKDLGQKMKKKQICWQDMEFCELILRFCRKYSKIAGKNSKKISNIIIGSDGSVHLLGMYSRVEQSSMKIIQNLKNLWLQTLYGQAVDDKLINDLENACQFKHPLSLQLIQNLGTKIEEQVENRYENIANPHLKFIRDYITAYHYRLDFYNEKLVDISMTLKQWRRAKELLNNHMVANNLFTIISEENYQLYKKLYKIQCMIDKNSPEVIQSMVRISTTAGCLAQKFKQKNEYEKSFNYYNECQKFTRSKLDEQFYGRMVQVTKALYLNNQTQNILTKSLVLHPHSRILNLVLIMHLCDCMRVDEAQRLLKKVTSDFTTLQFQLSSAKILLTKAILFPNQKTQFVQQSRDFLSNIVLQRHMKKGSTHTAKSIAYTSPLYHEIMGDSYLQERSFTKAREQYQLSKRVIKNERGCGFRMANMIAAQANCYLMQGKFDQSIMLYTEAISQLGKDCKNFMDSVVGNRAIAKIKKGVREEGIRQIQDIMNSTPHQIVQRDYNYIFLNNFLNNAMNH